MMAEQLTIVSHRTVAADASPFRRPAVELAGASAQIQRIRELVRRAAATPGGTLLVAERGTDVESVARELHAQSGLEPGAFVRLDCTAGDAADIDRVLFGTTLKAGPSDLETVSSDCSIAASRGGTLMIQDVAELPAAAQVRLARVTRDGEVRIDGQAVPTALRFIASASAGIDADVQANRFRGDLFRRLARTRIDLPPLRERHEDIPILAALVLEDLSAAHGAGSRNLTDAALALLGALAWPGNLAELRQVIERTLASTADPVIQIEHMLPALRLNDSHVSPAPAASLREARLRFEREYITAVLQRHEWRVADAARTLGIQRPNLYRKARQLGIPFTKGSH